VKEEEGKKPPLQFRRPQIVHFELPEKRKKKKKGKGGRENDGSSSSI